MKNLEIAKNLIAKAELTMSAPAHAEEYTIKVGNYRNTVAYGGDPKIKAAQVIEAGLRPLDARLPDFDAACEMLEAFVAKHDISAYCSI